MHGLAEHAYTLQHQTSLVPHLQGNEVSGIVKYSHFLDFEGNAEVGVLLEGNISFGHLILQTALSLCISFDSLNRCCSELV